MARPASVPTSGTPQGQGEWGPLGAGTGHKDFEWVRDRSLKKSGFWYGRARTLLAARPSTGSVLGTSQCSGFACTQPNSWKPRECVKPLQVSLVCEDKVTSSADPSPGGWRRPGWRPVDPRPACQRSPSGLFPKSLNLCHQRWLRSAPPVTPAPTGNLLDCVSGRVIRFHPFRADEN